MCIRDRFPYFSLAKGFLAGKYRAESDVTAPGASVRASGAAEYLNDRGFEVLATLDAISEAHSTTPATAALAWLRQQPTIAAPIASARTTEQLPSLLASLSFELSDAELLQLSEAGA